MSWHEMPDGKFAKSTGFFSRPSGERARGKHLEKGMPFEMKHFCLSHSLLANDIALMLSELVIAQVGLSRGEP